MNAIAQVSAARVSGPKLDNRRVAAAIIDLLIVSAGAVAILVAGDSLSGDRQGALGAVILGWALYYFFATESGEGQTLGKRVMKLRVVRADGRPANMGEIAVRTVLRVIDNYLVGMIVMLATGERRQRIGDLAAGTIVVDASGPAVASPAPAAVAEPEEEAVEADEPDAAVEPVASAEAVEDEPVATKTISLPSRPAPPATLADLSGHEAVEDAPAAMEEPVVEVEPAEEPVVEVEPAEEPAAQVEPVEELVVEAESVEDRVVEVEPVEEPVAEEPVVEVEPVDEPVADVEPGLPPVASPAIEELADDVAAAHAEPIEDEPADDEPVNVKSVETVSAIDLVMGAADGYGSESASESSQDSEDPASA